MSKCTQSQRTTTLCQSTTFYNASTIVQVIQIQNTISKDFAHFKGNLRTACIANSYLLHVAPLLHYMSASCVEQECGSCINHPEPSTLIVKLFHRHQCACEYKRSIICEKARVYSTYINLYTCKNAMQPTHQKHRSTWITSVEHHKISQN